MQSEEAPDMNNADNQTPSGTVQGLNSGMPIQESVDGWIRSTQREAHEPDSNWDEDRQIEVIAWRQLSQLLSLSTNFMIRYNMVSKLSQAQNYPW